MRKTILLLVAVIGGMLVDTPAQAAKAGKREARMAARMLGRFDANKDGSLDAKESERVRKAFAALKGLDSDKNGELSDSEIDVAKVSAPKGKRNKKAQQ
jgi:hypothetical protein